MPILELNDTCSNQLEDGSKSAYIRVNTIYPHNPTKKDHEANQSELPV